MKREHSHGLSYIFLPADVCLFSRESAKWIFGWNRSEIPALELTRADWSLALSIQTVRRLCLGYPFEEKSTRRRADDPPELQLISRAAGGCCADTWHKHVT